MFFLLASSSSGTPFSKITRSIGGLVVEYIVAIDVTRVPFPADAYFGLCPGQTSRTPGGPPSPSLSLSLSISLSLPIPKFAKLLLAVSSYLPLLAHCLHLFVAHFVKGFCSCICTSMPRAKLMVSVVKSTTIWLLGLVA